MTLIKNLIQEGCLKTPRIIEAFRKIRRADFLLQLPTGNPEDVEELAELNEALSIGFDQTISQPLVVAFMLELLAPKEGDKILDVGSGSGWTSALLAEIVGEKGKVIAVEIIPELKEFGEKNASKYNFVKKGQVQFILADGSKGFEKEAPYDKILASAAAEEIPLAWKQQLKIGGRIVAPIGNSIWLFVKKKESMKFPSSPSSLSHSESSIFDEKEYPGFVFVPLITK